MVEGEYRLNYVTTACMGTMVAIASWSPPESPDAALTMWSTTQVPFLYQRDLAEALGITGDRVRVMQPPVGGNFGRGLDLYPIDIIAALLARRAGRPVKIAFERIEEFIASPTREPCVIHLRTAADRDGRLLARDARVVIDNGAYVSWGSTTPYVMLSTTAGLYRVPAVRFDTSIVYTNNPYSGSMRGYGNLESTFAIEAQMDDLAERLGLDRVEIRRRNATRSGDVNPQGNVITSCAMTECLDAVEREMSRAAGEAPRPGWRRGVGYAAMFHVGGGARVYRSDGCGAILKLDDFGKVSLLTGASEIGQGSETVLAMIVAEELGVPLGRIEVVNSDTVHQAVGRGGAREPHHVHRGQRRAAWRRAHPQGQAPRPGRLGDGRASGRPRAGRRPRPGQGASGARHGVRPRGAGRPLPRGRPDPGGGGLLRPAQRDAVEGPARQRLRRVRLRGPGRAGGGEPGDRRRCGC